MRRGHGLGIETKPGVFPPKGATWAPPRAQGDWRIPKYAVFYVEKTADTNDNDSFAKIDSKVERFAQKSEGTSGRS